jgi:hypothetical protein
MVSMTATTRKSRIGPAPRAYFATVRRNEATMVNDMALNSFWMNWRVKRRAERR